MNKPYIELRNRNDFGDTINTYFLFLKYNFKEYTSLYLRYNAISIILVIIASYLLVTGFMGFASRDFRFGMNNDGDHTMYLIAGAIVLALILFVTALINYSFSSSYMAEYVNSTGHVESKNVWQNIQRNLGPIILFILLGIGLYIGYLIVSVIFAFIPLIGMLIQYGLSFLLTAFFGLTFMAIFSENKGLGHALSEGWSFTFSSFGKVILYGLVIGILNMMITMLIISIPGFIIGIYVYFSIESHVDLVTSVFANVVFTLGFAMFLLAFIYSQALSQVAYSVLYYNIFEEKNNVFLRNKIEQIGVNE
ncbi:hypothetical protein CJ739_2484 [Mariniflexile rhizosphaerae]|uniref:hypothetical protein n=1 Tax=unclassified Mariniflexile TaxID=2643887 RepID=UPI000CADFF9A|nr:hypothetical protein [Mariniflexile sp. TRM1-10]AXP81557.1 hypothetical protein CJ739_2484 [Mariniflexile sp. TRM1-10]PLB17832.1 MAG: putative membrane protein [Flavobacteriaceae bacterium FS1-H7996/R]